MKINLNHILIVFLVILSIILNLNIDMKLKCYFLLTAIILCIYKPSLIIPFSVSILLLFLINKKLNLKNKILSNKKIETFYNQPNNNFEAIISKYQPVLIDFLENRTNFNSIISLDTNIKVRTKHIYYTIFNINTNGINSDTLNKIKLIKELLSCYFFDLKNMYLILHLAKISQFQTFRSLYNFFFSGINIFKIKEQHKEIKELLKKYYTNNIDKVRFSFKHILGIYIKQNLNTNINLNKVIINSIKEIGLYSIINNQFVYKKPLSIQEFKPLNINDFIDPVTNKTNKANLDKFKQDRNKEYQNYLKTEFPLNKKYDLDYDLIKKNVYELVIDILYYNKYLRIDNYNFYEYFKFEYFNEFEKNNSYINLFANLENYTKHSYIEELYSNKGNQDNKYILNLIKNIINFDYFSQRQNKIIKIFDDKFFEKEILSIDNKTNLDEYLNSMFDNFEDNIIESGLLKLYRLKNNEKDNVLKFTIFNNLSILFFITNKNLADRINDIITSEKLSKIFNLIIENHKKIISKQIELEEKNNTPLRYSNLGDLLLDNIIHVIDLYFRIQTNNINTFINTDLEKILTYDFIEYSSTINNTQNNENTDENIVNPISEEQALFERDFDKYLDMNEQLKKNKEDELTKFYDILKNEKYNKIQDTLQPLNELAQQQDKIDKLEKLSMNNIIDNFSDNVFSIIDEIKSLFEKVEFFNNNNPDSSQLSNTTFTVVKFLYQVFIILTKQDRILYSGFILIMLALFIYFIENENYRGDDISKLKNVLQVLKI